MAYLTGIIEYLGSFKSIRNYRVAHNKKILAGEKGGAHCDLIKNNAAFDLIRKNMSEFAGCGIAVKAIRIGLLQLIPEYTDTHFTGRLVKLVKMINVRDETGERGKRAINFSLNRPIMKTLVFNVRKKFDIQFRRCITHYHPESRTEATIMVNGLIPSPALVPGKAQYYRIFNHLNVISDYAYNERNRRYEPLNPIDSMSAFAYSDYTPVNTPLTAALKAAFPVGTVLSETDTVLQCVGIEYYIRSGEDGYVPYAMGSIMVEDVF